MVARMVMQTHCQCKTEGPPDDGPIRYGERAFDHAKIGACLTSWNTCLPPALLLCTTIAERTSSAHMSGRHGLSTAAPALGVDRSRSPGPVTFGAALSLWCSSRASCAACRPLSADRGRRAASPAAPRAALETTRTCRARCPQGGDTAVPALLATFADVSDA